MSGTGQDEECHIYILRYEDRNEWLAKAERGEEPARVCQWAASKFMKGLATEHSVCGCCEFVFSERAKPRAFVVLIPIERDPDNVRAHAIGVCAACSKHDNQWLIDQSVRRKGLSLSEPRPGDNIH